MIFFRLSFVGVLTLIIALPLQAADGPRVVVSIAPIHSLVAGVMAGVATPELLISGAASPHSYMLKPSQVRALQRADLIVWNGESVESFMPRTLRSIGSGQRVIKLVALPDMALLSSRSGGFWQQDAHSQHDHVAGEMDGHLWLDTTNAKVIVVAVAVALSEIDPGHAAQYRRNSTALLQQLDELTREIDATLTPVRTVPYLVFHDGYHYFEDRFKLRAAGAISVDAEHKPGAKRLSEISAMVKRQQVRCVFSEPQYSAATVQLVTAGTGVKSGVLDGIGSGLQPGPDLYFKLMRGLAQNLAGCLR